MLTCEQDHDTKTSSTSLGFVLPTPTESSDLTSSPESDLAPEEKVKAMVELIKQNSIAAVKEISEDLALLAVEATTPTKVKLEILDAHMRLAQLDKKGNDQAHAPGQGYQLVINIGQPNPEKFSGITVEQIPDAAV